MLAHRVAWVDLEAASRGRTLFKVMRVSWEKLEKFRGNSLAQTYMLQLIVCTYISVNYEGIKVHLKTNLFSFLLN